MKSAVITVLIFLAVITAFDRGRSLPRMTEITLAEPVFAIGVDKTHDSTRISLIYEKIEDSDEGGGDVNQKYIQSATASTAAAALEKLKKNSPRETAVNTADYFLIGEAAATESIDRYTDFLLRNNTLRLTSSVFIVRGEAASACEILVETGTLDILRNFGEYSGINAVSSEMKFFELLSHRAKGEAYTIPALIIKNFGNRKIAVPSGYAIIKDGNLAGFLDSGTARGYNLLKNKSTYSTIEINTDSLHFATRLENSRRRIRFEWDGDDLSGIVVDVDITTSLIDRGNAELDAAFIEEAQKRVILGELLGAVEASRQHGCDFLGFGEALRMRHPLRWERIRDNREKIYAETNVQININSKLGKL